MNEEEGLGCDVFLFLFFYLYVKAVNAALTGFYSLIGMTINDRQVQESTSFKTFF